MEVIENKIKNKKSVNLTKQLDIRELVDSLQVKVYATGKYIGRNFNKTLFITMDYDVSRPVNMYMTYKGKHLIEAFLYLKSSDFSKGEIKLSKQSFESDVIIKLNVENNRTVSLTQVGSKNNKSLLTTREIFSVGKNSALNRFSRVLDKKGHALEMVIPNVKTILYDKPEQSVGISGRRKDSISLDVAPSSEPTKLINLGFDVDIKAFSLTGPLTSLFFKLTPPNIDNKKFKKYKRGKTGTVDSIIQVSPRKIKTLKNAPTSYIQLGGKELELGEVKFNYDDYFKKINQNYKDFYLENSEIFIVKNDESYKLNMGNFLKDSVNELPFNVSRNVESNVISSSSPYFESGRELYPLSWASELRNNQFFSEMGRCTDINFYSTEHLYNFEQTLKENQIANLEEFITTDLDGKIVTEPRYYNDVNQWLGRSNSDYFNDLNIEYTTKGKFKNVTLCPTKRTKINNYVDTFKYKDTKCLCSYTDDSSEKFHQETVESGGKPCNEVCLAHKKLLNFGKCWTCEPNYYSPIKNLQYDFFGTTYSSFRESFSDGTNYTEYTSGGILGDNVYDIYFSGSGFTATTDTSTGISIPITNIKRLEHKPFVGVNSPSWAPYYSWQSLSGESGSISGSGSVIIQSADSKNYLMYKCLVSGQYRTQYNGHLNVKYKDNKWCEYITQNYSSGKTSSLGYPNTEYEIKRLINTSIIQRGQGEGDVVKLDTKGVYFPGKDGVNYGSGVENFFFDVFIEKTDNSGNTSNIVGTSIGLSKLQNPSSNTYLGLKTNTVQNSMSGYNQCYSSATTANTIFNSSIPITLDSGLINLVKGDTIILKYNTEFKVSSKVSGGIANLELNLGNKLNSSGDTVSSPFYRITKYNPNSGSTDNLVKRLFLNPQKISTPQKYLNKNGETIEKSTTGTLYVIDDKTKPITPPKVDNQTFNNLNFVDNEEKDTKLLLNIITNKPTNNWSTQLENNSLTDYYIPNNIGLLQMKSEVLVFNLPRYDQQMSINCNYKFPQISHSYVIKNTISNVVGQKMDHFIVITPKEKLYVPCLTPTKDDKVELIQTEIKLKEQIDNVDDVILIDNRPIILKPSRSEPLTQFKSDEGFVCKFYCVCKDKKSNIPIDSFYGTTQIITDTDIEGCDECVDKSEEYCVGVNQTCEPRVFNNSCQDSKNNLYTYGGEYLLPNSGDYVGFYHIHDGVYMVGAVHTVKPHTILIPVGGDDINYVGGFTVDNIGTTTSVTNTTINYNTNTGGGGY